MKNIILNLFAIVIMLVACNKKPQVPASIISINDKEYTFHNVTSYEAGRSPVSYIETDNITDLYNNMNNDVKFFLQANDGILPTGQAISLELQAREGVTDAQIQIYRNDTLFRIAEIAYMQGSYSDNIVRYTIEKVKFVACKRNPPDAAVPTTDTVLISGTIYGYSDR